MFITVLCPTDARHKKARVRSQESETKVKQKSGTNFLTEVGRASLLIRVVRGR